MEGETRRRILRDKNGVTLHNQSQFMLCALFGILISNLEFLRSDID